ncbi:hypothetical protein V8E54_007632 [Elaphomyces granulatus]
MSRAVEEGIVAIVQLLLARGREQNPATELAASLIKSPLPRAAEKGDKSVVKLLHENGARPDFEDEDGKTPLRQDTRQSRAAEKGRERVVRLLLVNGARPDFEDEDARHRCHELYGLVKESLLIY